MKGTYSILRYFIRFTGKIVLRRLISLRDYVGF